MRQRKRSGKTGRVFNITKEKTMRTFKGTILTTRDIYELADYDLPKKKVRKNDRPNR